MTSNAGSWFYLAAVVAGLGAVLIAAYVALILTRSRTRMEQIRLDTELQHKRLEDRRGISVRVNTSDGGEIQMAFPPDTDPEGVEQVVKSLIREYNSRLAQPDKVEGASEEANVQPPPAESGS
jgi:hypothetical protein